MNSFWSRNKEEHILRDYSYGTERQTHSLPSAEERTSLLEDTVRKKTSKSFTDPEAWNDFWLQQRFLISHQEKRKVIWTLCFYDDKTESVSVIDLLMMV